MVTKTAKKTALAKAIEENGEIISKLGPARLELEVSQRGLHFHDSEADGDGFRDCYTLDNESNASGTFNVNEGNFINRKNPSDNCNFFTLMSRIAPAEFPEPQHAKRHFANEVGVKIRLNKPKETFEDWISQGKFRFHERDEGTENLLRLFGIIEKPGVSYESLNEIGARYASHFHAAVIAIPVNGADGLNGYQCIPYSRYSWPEVDRDGNLTGEYTKIKSTPGCKNGVYITPDDLEVLRNNPSQVKALVRFEGPTCMLAALSKRTPEDRGKIIPFSVSGGLAQIPTWFLELLKDKVVYLVGDNDRDGLGAIDRLNHQIGPYAKQVIALRLPGLESEKHGSDARDYFNAGNDLADLFDLPRKTAEKPFSNYREFGEGEIEPRELEDIANDLIKRTDGWPKRVGSNLFVDTGKKEDPIRWLRDSSDLFSWIKREIPNTEWKDKKDGLITKVELLKDLKANAESFTDISHLPHEPSIPGIYYTSQCRASYTAEGDGSLLDEFVNRFNPDDEHDRQLIAAYFTTLFWGGAGGRRPIFLVTSDDGTGSGKSKLCEIAGKLAGGSMLFGQTEPIETLKTRLLSDSGRKYRHVFLDNLKSNKFSSGELEGLITSEDISGRGLYVGNANRPNHLVFGLTVNGASLSRDLSERSIVIKVKKPKAYSANWESTTFDFIERFHTELVNDILWSLRNRPTLDIGAAATRWPLWERDILSRCCLDGDDLRKVQDLLKVRRGAVDADGDEFERFEWFVEEKLAYLGYDTESDNVFIASKTMCEWWNEANNTREKVVAVGRNLKQMISQKGSLCKLSPKDTTKSRGFLFKFNEGNDEFRNDIEERTKHYELEKKRRDRESIRGYHQNF